MPRTKIKESKLLKALAELEGKADELEKGDALENADPEGAFATEGTPLSNKAPSGKSDTKKSDGDDDSDDGDDGSSMAAKAFSASDAESEAPKKKTKKPFPPKGNDDSSSDDDDAEKSFRETADGDETMAKAIEVSDFLEAMVDQISLTMLTMGKSISKSIGELESRLNARIDNRVSKGIGLQQEFNTRLAKAITAIGTSVEDQGDLVKSLANSPATTAPRGKAILSKAEVNQPPWGGGNNTLAAGNEPDVSELGSLAPDKIGDWLFAKSATNQIDPRVIMAWEADHYDPKTLPENIQKAIVNDLCK
jgi:hypothetical protein